MSNLKDILDIIKTIHERNVNIMKPSKKIYEEKDEEKYNIKPEKAPKRFFNVNKPSTRDPLSSMKDILIKIRESILKEFTSEISLNERIGRYITNITSVINIIQTTTDINKDLYKDVFEVVEQINRYGELYSIRLKGTNGANYTACTHIKDKEDDLKQIEKLISACLNIIDFFVDNKPLKQFPEIKIRNDIKNIKDINPDPKENMYTIYIEKETGKLKCGNKFEPKCLFKKYNYHKECINGTNDIDIFINLFNVDIRPIIKEFWSGKSELKIENKNVDINTYRDHYINKINNLKLDENTDVDRKNAIKFINYYTSKNEKTESEKKSDSKNKFTIEYDNGMPYCDNKKRPEDTKQTFEKWEDCMKAINQGEFGFNDTNIAPIIKEFWMSRHNIERINAKNGEDPITKHANIYTNKLIKLQSDPKLNIDKKEFDIAMNIIKHYEDNYKYVIYETKDKTKKVCRIDPPKKNQKENEDWFHTPDACKNKLSSAK